LLLKGGRTTYGEAIGIMVLDTRFPRVPGDVGNASTYSFPVRLKVVKGATVERVVKKADPTLLPLFIKAARELEAEGVRAITTSCGFLIIFQDELAKAVRVPVFTSSLIQVPLVHKMVGGRVGIVTADAGSLTEMHLRKAGIDPSIPVAIAGLENEEEFSRAILGNSPDMDVEKIEAEVVKVSKRLVSEHPDVKAIVFECANLPPYAKAVQDATGLPVFDIITLANMVYNAVVRRRFTGFL